MFSLAARMGKVSDVPYTSVVGSGACTAKQSFVPTRRTPALPSCPRARSNASKLASWHLIFGRTAECKKDRAPVVGPRGSRATPAEGHAGGRDPVPSGARPRPARAGAAQKTRPTPT